MCDKGPGPGAYLLPSTVGYANHDPSRYRNPQFSIRGQTGGRAGCGAGPGPGYDVSKLTRYGKHSPPAYSISSRAKQLSAFQTPGPGTYSLADGKRNPAFTIASRYPEPCGHATPGPNQYLQPSCIGPKVPHKPALPAYSMMGKSTYPEQGRSPGPASYAGVNLDSYKYKPPKYSLAGRHTFEHCDSNPGPAAYLPGDLKCRFTGYSFGSRTTATPYITADDFIPCITRE